MGKKKGTGKKQEDDYWDNGFEQDAELTGAATNLTLADGTTETTENGAPASAADNEEEGGLMAMMKSAASKKNKRKQEQLKSDIAEEPAVGIKSKKEKEKERKERQKQKQKTTAQPKQQQQQSDQKDAAVEKPTEELEKPQPTPDSPPTKKGKKKGAPVAALREFLAAKQAAEEEQQRLEEEANKAEGERLRKLEEEEREKAEQRRLKKEREKARKEQLKKEGKYLTETEKKKIQTAQAKLEAMRAAGMIIPALERTASASNADADTDGKKKRVVYDSRKKKNQQRKKQELDEPAAATPAVPVAKAEDNVADSWEEVAESWEDMDTEEVVEENKEENADNIEEESENEESDEESSDDDETVERRKLEQAKEKREQRHKDAMAARSMTDLRSPICVILGHVDTGKTKLLDKIRQTNVQEGEAGGITQQIGATYFPTESILEKTQVIRDSKLYGGISEKTGFSQHSDIRVPGLLVIDTPGHESFTNLRSRGSSLCNIAILVVDIMHGLEPQTIESINLLKARKTPFIVALNKIDRIYGWNTIPNNAFLDSFENQSKSVKKEFEDRLAAVKVAFAEQGLNADLYTVNKDVRKYVSLVPTSAVTGEGVPDMLNLLVQLTQNRLTDSLMYLSELEATVLEVKVIEGLGTTIDVILSNGILREGDRIVLCGLNGPICTNIRALLTPQPMRELRVKSAYVHHKEIKAAMGVKISAPDLEKAIAGSRLLVLTPEDDEDELREEVMNDLTDLFEFVDKSGKGVCVQASTLGSLEALLSFLKVSKIPVAVINIGPVSRKDVMRASVMKEHGKEFATILAFDVKIDKEIQEMADEMGVNVFRADIIYHLFDQFTAYMKKVQEAKLEEMASAAIWPCTLKIVPDCIFNKKDPIILGVDVTDGTCRIGTPVCVPSKGNVVLGKIAGIEANHKPVEIAKKGQQVAIRIEAIVNDTPKIAGRHFEESDELVSKITRRSIDVLKEGFRDQVTREEWLLVKRLKTLLRID